ncbi:MAG: iron-containing alcohol dehydrogenase [Patescibacteria group bacterium]|nr:iron-containing alcohol dehydrogenase [Patescibacteria group bacterium]
MKRYYLPTKIYFGSGIFKYLADILGQRRKKIYLIIDSYFSKAELPEKVKHFFPKAKIEVFDRVTPNPTLLQVEKLRRKIKDFETELIIAIGGGSTLDMGKSTSILSGHSGKLMSFLTKKRKLNKKGIPFVAIPTTAGTGSEVTPWATIWKDKTKYSLSSPLMFPYAALCDPELTLTMPSYLTACTGMDALCQAIEAYWSIHSTLLSDIHAEKAIPLIINNLKKTVKNPQDLFYREQMMTASLEAGRAFSQTATTAVHAVSYPITSYFNIPHGHACALILPSFLKYNYNVSDKNCNDKRGTKFIRQKIKKIIKLLGCNNIDDASTKIKSLMSVIRLETSLSKAGVNDIEIIVEQGFNPDRVVNNPRLLTKNNLRDLLKEIY